MHKLCKHCGKDFVSYDSRVRYCSKECRIKHSNGQRKPVAVHEERICPECGEVFVSRRSNSVYCSRTCIMRVANRKRVKMRKK